MNRPDAPVPSGLDDWPTELAPQLLSALAPTDGHPPDGLRQRLLQRAHRSAADQAGFLTVRRTDAPWGDWQAGRRTRVLRDAGVLQVAMVELQPGAVVPPLEDEQVQAQELLVVQGRLRIQNAAGAPTELPAQSYALRSAASTGADRAAHWRAPEGALLYVRSLTGPRGQLPPDEARWWPAAGAAPLLQPAGQTGWLPFAPGVHIKPLAGSDAAISMLARFVPGASVRPHGHGLDEDCLMLQGDLYLGDVLLLEGEYQLAPRGSRHNGLMSDTGAVLFFHGAVDAGARR
jgi:hypothetical protein